MRIYEKPVGGWNEIAKRYRKPLETYLASPPIEFQGRRYMVVEYFSILVASQFPRVPTRGILVIQDGRDVVDDPRMVYTITRAGFALSAYADEQSIGLLERDAYGKNVSTFRKGIQVVNRLAIPIQSYVVGDSLSNLLEALKEILDAMIGEEKGAQRSLQIWGVLVRSKTVDIRLLEGFLQIQREDEKLGIMRHRAATKAGNLSRQVMNELIAQRDLRGSQSSPQDKKVLREMINWLKEFADEIESLPADTEVRLDADLAASGERALQRYRAPLRGYTGREKIEPYPIPGAEEVIAALPPFHTHPLWPTPGYQKDLQWARAGRITAGCLGLFGLVALLFVLYGIITVGPLPALLSTAVLLLGMAVMALMGCLKR